VLEGADAWANRDIFQIDKEMNPTNVAGVPPDYFSEDGQKWGNPLYKWFDKNNNLNEPTYSWWKKRILHLASMFDVVRIDHFRAFEAYWAVPEKEKTAKNGEWLTGPGCDFFIRLQKECGRLPFIAEDLGIITPEVELLRDQFDFPGMKIMQFAFDQNSDNYYLPHNISNPNCILYTGTHDNNTTNGWFYEGDISQESQEYIMEYLDIDSFGDMHFHIIKSALMTISNLVIIPMQDLLGFGAHFRMNKPGTVENNWVWKLKSSDSNNELVEKFLRLLKLYGRA
jgi:4-alpha-glucanotransferase